MIVNVIKNYNIKELIKYLKRKDLKFKKIHFKILYKKEITGLIFFKLIEKNFE